MRVPFGRMRALGCGNVRSFGVPRTFQMSTPSNPEMFVHGHRMSVDHSMLTVDPKECHLFSEGHHSKEWLLTSDWMTYELRIRMETDLGGLDSEFQQRTDGTYEYKEPCQAAIFLDANVLIDFERGRRG